MRAKSEAQIFLESYEMDKVKMECKLSERQYWHDLSLTITGQMGGERVQTSGAKDKMAQARDACIDMENDILSQVKTLVVRQKKVTGVLDLMNNPTEYKLLHLKYIQGKELEEIADNFRSEYSAITSCHGRAIKSVETILKSL